MQGLYTPSVKRLRESQRTEDPSSDRKGIFFTDPNEKEDTNIYSDNSKMI
jgi:hypothetical protein